MTSPEHSDSLIPDFEKDAQVVAAYEEARQRHERREAGDAEARTRASFAKKRDAVRAEIAVAATLLDEKRSKAQKALAHYAARYPQRIERNKPLKPSFWENLLSFGSAGRAYRATVTTAEDAVQAQSLRRRKEHDEEELEQQLKRALYLQEDAIKKKLESSEGLAAFHARPGIAGLVKRVDEIRAERAAYAARVEQGLVSAEEQRDRDFAERRIAPLEAPFDGVMFVRVARFGPLTYLIGRNLEKKLFSLTYDPRLEPLLEGVLDVFRIADAFEVKLRRQSDGRPFSALDHFIANFKDEEIARLEYRRVRTALRAPRTDVAAAAPGDDAERALIDLLANFARTLGTGTIAAINSPGGIAAPAPAPALLDPVGREGGTPGA